MVVPTIAALNFNRTFEIRCWQIGTISNTEPVRMLHNGVSKDFFINRHTNISCICNISKKQSLSIVYPGS